MSKRIFLLGIALLFLQPSLVRADQAIINLRMLQKCAAVFKRVPDEVVSNVTGALGLKRHAVLKNGTRCHLRATLRHRTSKALLPHVPVSLYRQVYEGSEAGIVLHLLQARQTSSTGRASFILRWNNDACGFTVQISSGEDTLQGESFVFTKLGC